MMKTNRTIHSLALFYLCLPVVVLLFCGVSWAIRYKVTPFTFPLALLTTFTLICKITELKRRQAVQFLCGNIILLCGIGLICFLIQDIGGDSYHQESAYLLSHGWNPIYSPVYTGIEKIKHSQWCYCYAKGQETINASIVSLTGNIEIGKLGNFFLPISCLMFVYLSLDKIFVAWSNKKLWIISAIVSFPPVVVSQVLTYYIDFNLYSIFVIFLFTSLLHLQSKEELFIFVNLLSLAFSIKFNIFIWFVLFTGIKIILQLWQKDYKCIKLYFVSGIGALTICLLTFAYNPYVSNTIYHGSPFYPLFGGNGRVDIMTMNAPKFFRYKKHLLQVFYATTSRPTIGSQGNMLKYQNPYTSFNLKNILGSFSFDARLGGYGTFWIDVLLLSLLGLVISKRLDPIQVKYTVGLIAIFFLFQILVPGGWWARYVSFIYLIPILLLFCIERSNKTKWSRGILNMGYGVLLLNMMTNLFVTLLVAICMNIRTNYYVKCIKHTKIGGVYFSDSWSNNYKIGNLKKKTVTITPEMSNVHVFYIDLKKLNQNINTNKMENMLIDHHFIVTKQ